MNLWYAIGCSFIFYVWTCNEIYIPRVSLFPHHPSNWPRYTYIKHPRFPLIRYGKLLIEWILKLCLGEVGETYKITLNLLIPLRSERFRVRIYRIELSWKKPDNNSKTSINLPDLLIFRWGLYHQWNFHYFQQEHPLSQWSFALKMGMGVGKASVSITKIE